MIYENRVIAYIDISGVKHNIKESATNPELGGLLLTSISTIECVFWKIRPRLTKN